MTERKMEREFEIGRDEAWFANVKRMYDEYQDLSLESTRRKNSHFDKQISDAQQFDNQRQVIANQALQNAVETANLTGKQAVRHGDLAIDRQWNIDEQNFTVMELLKALSVDTTTLRSVVAQILAAMAKSVADEEE